uniref:Transposase n=1 Tax=Panagrellus redivivus TaxID=6233 RepID=A0A7E4V7Y6_PANRE
MSGRGHGNNTQVRHRAPLCHSRPFDPRAVGFLLRCATAAFAVVDGPIDSVPKGVPPVFTDQRPHPAAPWPNCDCLTRACRKSGLQAQDNGICWKPLAHIPPIATYSLSSVALNTVMWGECHIDCRHGGFPLIDGFKKISALANRGGDGFVKAAQIRYQRCRLDVPAGYLQALIGFSWRQIGF